MRILKCCKKYFVSIIKNEPRLLFLMSVIKYLFFLFLSLFILDHNVLITWVNNLFIFAKYLLARLLKIKFLFFFCLLI